LKSAAGVDESWAAWRREAAVVALFTGVSTVVMGTLPLLNGLFAEHLRLGWRDLGWLGAASQAGTLVGTLIGYWITTRGSLRTGVQVAAALAVVAWLFASTADQFPQLVVGRMVASIGLGCIFSIGTFALAHSSSPARSFSVMSGVQIAVGSLHSACLPWIHLELGHTAAVASIAVWFVMILWLGRYAQPRGTTMQHPNAVPRRARGAARFIGAELLLSLMAFQMAVATFWAYSERIASASGLPEEEIATAIAIGNLGGIPAALLGAWAGKRFGYLAFLVLATISAIGGELVMARAHTQGSYLAGQFIFNFGWILGISYYLALLASRAADSRTIQAAPTALVIASAIGLLSVAISRASSSSALVMLALLLCCGALIPALFRRPIRMAAATRRDPPNG
jgi:predicted MFS family arabinose efflux permease